MGSTSKNVSKAVMNIWQSVDVVVTLGGGGGDTPIA